MIVYNKVRDRIPEIIEASGKRCDTRHILSREECLAMLRTKLQAEIAEYEESGELEELAGILEILHALPMHRVSRQGNWMLYELIKPMIVGDSKLFNKKAFTITEFHTFIHVYNGSSVTY